jgi:hypothetical protein
VRRRVLGFLVVPRCRNQRWLGRSWRYLVHGWRRRQIVYRRISEHWRNVIDRRQSRRRWHSGRGRRSCVRRLGRSGRITFERRRPRQRRRFRIRRISGDRWVTFERRLSVFRWLPGNGRLIGELLFDDVQLVLGLLLLWLLVREPPE